MTMATSTEQLNPDVQDFVSQPRKMLINGQWVDAKSGKTFPVYNPAIGEVVAQVAEGDKADIDLAVRAARKAFEQDPWRKMTPSDRGKLIWRLADLLESNLEELKM